MSRQNGKKRGKGALLLLVLIVVAVIAIFWWAGSDEEDEQEAYTSQATEAEGRRTESESVQVVGLGDSAPEETGQTGAQSGSTQGGTQSGASQGSAQSGSTQGSAPGSGTQEAPPVETVSIEVEEGTGKMTVERPEREERIPMGPKGSWTIFIYLCGSDLESEEGMATADLKEMKAASSKAGFRFVVETGGAWEWQSGISARKNERYLIENGAMTKVAEKARSGMGQTATLADFLQWGVGTYPAEKMGLILWDHGGGSIQGVCFDEREDYDALTLRELDAALMSVRPQMTDNFSFIGFDACLMSTLETANILASYADYMIASEELEPGSGWDYESIGRAIKADPSADGAAFGRAVCDAYLEACSREGEEEIATLAVVDLRKIDPVLVAFNTFSESMYAVGDDEEKLGEMVRGIKSAENFGGNNRVEGYTNMVDLGGLVRACEGYAEGTSAVLSAIDQAVVYQVRGSGHANACGLSLYYPLSVQGSEELSVFSTVCVSPFYLSFVDRQSQSLVSGSYETEYDDEEWFDEGFWQFVSGLLFDDDTGFFEYEEEEDDYWDYAEGYEQTGESPFITFEEEPQLDDTGHYWFVLDDDGWTYASAVYGYVFELSEDGEDVIEIGETVDVVGDWETGYFEDDFDGWWLSLPDGQNLATYIVEYGDDYVLYTSPVLLNDELMYLRLRQYDDYSVVVEGAWYGISDSGAAGREIYRIEAGDVIVPVYQSFGLEDEEEDYYTGVEYHVRGELNVEYEQMEPGSYLYCFCIDDIYGDYFMTDFVQFDVEEDGSVSFYED